MAVGGDRRGECCACGRLIENTCASLIVLRMCGHSYECNYYPPPKISHSSRVLISEQFKQGLAEDKLGFLSLEFFFSIPRSQLPLKSH